MKLDTLPFAAESHVEIERLARCFEEQFQARAVACAQAVQDTAGIIQNHLHTWRENLCQQMQKQLADLSIGCPPSFIRVAGQSHLEKPFNRLLAWLVDPEGDHGWGDTFLKKLAQRASLPAMVEDLAAAADPACEVVIRAEQSLDGDDSGKEPDLAIRTDRAALLLENKVWAPESGDQYGPYLGIFRQWAGPHRHKRAWLCAKDERVVPPGWDGFLFHQDLAEILFEMSRLQTPMPTWSRICAVMCGTAFMDENDSSKIIAARQILREVKIGPATPDQVTRLRDLLPLPGPVTPWKEFRDE